MIAFRCNNCVHRLVEGLKVAICSVYKLQAITIDELLDKSYWVAYQLYAYLLADVWSGLSLAGNRKQGMLSSLESEIQQTVPNDFLPISFLPMRSFSSC